MGWFLEEYLEELLNFGNVQKHLSKESLQEFPNQSLVYMWQIHWWNLLRNRENIFWRNPGRNLSRNFGMVFFEKSFEEIPEKSLILNIPWDFWEIFWIKLQKTLFLFFYIYDFYLYLILHTLKKVLRQFWISDFQKQLIKEFLKESVKTYHKNNPGKISEKSIEEFLVMYGSNFLEESLERIVEE